MPAFDDKRQQETIDALHEKEEEELARVLSSKYGVGYVNLSQTPINVGALRHIKEADARRGLLAAFEQIDKRISIAVKSPVADATKQIVASLAEKGYEPVLFMASTQSLEKAWSRYRELASASETYAGMLEITPEAIEKMLASVSTLDDVRSATAKTLTLDRAHRISSILETVLAGALKLSASDIHVEPEERSVRLRYRLDGVLTDVLEFDHETFGLLLSRIKLLSGLKLNVKNQAQDGRFSLNVQGNEIEIRSSILPGPYGESIVLRVLDPKTTKVPMEELGIHTSLLPILEREIRRPNGMLLNTGPTGSGKTTTLYAFLRKVHSPDIKIITIEDPIEYHLEGVVQTQVDHKDYTFESGLRSALRQDPDVIMVGEIRDREVAETAINAALTGHMVFSTLHTNTAAGAFPRLIDLGVNSRIIGSAVTVVMAQRLVRRLDQSHAEEVAVTQAQRELIERILESVSDKSLIPEKRDSIWQPRTGEEASGYKGRIGVFEAILMNKEIEDVVSMSGSEREVAAAAKSQGLLTLAQDGILKVLRGETSLAELERVLDISTI